MAEFPRQRGKRQEDGGLGSVLDLLLANARLVLGVSGAAVLAIATLAVKRVRPARPPPGLGGTVGLRRRGALVAGAVGGDALQTELALKKRCRWQRRGCGATCSHTLVSWNSMCWG